MRGMRTAILTFAVIVALSLTTYANDRPPIAQPFGASPDGGVPAYRVGWQRAELQTDPLFMGADHILAQQCHNGGFGWPHDDCSQTFHNITSPILLGVLGSYYLTRDTQHVLGVVSGGVFDLTSEFPNGEARFGSFTPDFLQQVAVVDDNTIFSTFVSEGLFDELAAGTYSPSDLDTAGWINEIETIRTGTWVNLRPWEFQTLIPSSRALGQPGQEAAFEQATLDGLNTLDNTDPANVYSDLLGVAGAVRGLAYARRYSFPAISAPLHSGIDGIDTLEALAAYLASLQNPNGSWYWHSNLAAPTVDDEDVQTTAYAVLALMEVDIMTAASYMAACETARNWIVSLQGPDGGIPTNPGGTENTEVEGEALSAVARFDSTILVDGFESGDTGLWTMTVP